MSSSGGGTAEESLVSGDWSKNQILGGESKVNYDSPPPKKKINTVLPLLPRALVDHELFLSYKNLLQLVNQSLEKTARHEK